MKILSHRGYWKNSEEKNREVAFERSFLLGFGTETDFRDLHQQLKIAHDPAREEDLDAMSMMRLWKQGCLKHSDLPLAINIKADGLQQLTRNVLDSFECENYFVFDMSIPDTLVWLKQGFNVFTRQSEFEPEPSFYREAGGVWLDPMVSEDWVNDDLILKHIDQGKAVCIVSPELHKREQLPFWESLLTWECAKSDQLMICTDEPEALQNLRTHD